MALRLPFSLYACHTVHDFGVFRGDSTGRKAPIDRDFEWLAIQLVGALPSPIDEDVSDPQVGVDFAAGMAEGAVRS